MKVVIDGQEFVPKPKVVPPPCPKDIVAHNDDEAAKLYRQFVPMCPECGSRAFPTNFPPASVGGEKEDKRVVWLCTDMGHCAFAIDETVKWRPATKEDSRNFLE